MDDTATLRRFNRFYTRHIGVLTDRYLGQGRPLGQARLLFEMASGATDLRELRARLELDSGYLTRLLRALVDQGLVRSGADPDDGRARRVRLTAAGRRAVAEMNRRADRAADEVLAGLTGPQRTDLVGLLGRAERLLRLGAVRVEPTDASTVDARYCLRRYADELRSRFPEGYADRDLVAPAETTVFLLAREAGRPVGCVAARTLSPTIGELRHLWVDPSARGIGLGRRLVAELEAAAARHGYRRLRLGTHDALTEAAALYDACGYRRIGPYGDTAHTHRWYEKRLPRRR